MEMSVVVAAAASRGELESITRRWMSLWSRYDPELADELHDPGFVDHAPDGRGCDLASFKSGIVALYAAFPDFTANLGFLVVDEVSATVAVSWSGAATHQGEFMGFAPTRAQIRFVGAEIIRIEKGRIRERWGEWNGASILAQLEEAASRR